MESNKASWYVADLYFEGSLEAASKEAAERPDEGREWWQKDAVDLEGV